MTDHLVPSFPADLDGFEIFLDQGSDRAQSRTLPKASGGNAPITYSISPALPDGLTLTEGVRFLSINAAIRSLAFARAEFTLTATDADGDTDTATIFITIDLNTQPTFGEQTIADQVFIQNVEIATLNLPEASGGNQPLTYEFGIPDNVPLPAGLSINGFEITGTPTGTLSETEYSWDAADSNQDRVELRFTITIEADVQPNFTDISVADQSFTQNTAITDLVLPEANSGNAPITYALTPALPAGLTLTGRTVSGTPTVALVETEYTWTATDANDDTAELTFDITVAEDTTPVFPDILDDFEITYVVGFSTSGFILDAATSGNEPITYSISPALPDGISLTDSGIPEFPILIGGTATTAQARAEYTLTATDADGDTDTATIFITVEADAEPNFTGISVADQVFTQDSEITALTLPEPNSGNAPFTYILAPALPDGLSREGRVISGTPTGTLDETTYEWTARDRDVDRADLTFTITVLPSNLVPTFGSASVTDKVYRTGSQISPVFLPTATGGDGSLTHTLSPALPTGLSLVGGTVIFGTPTEAVAEAEYTWTATDEDDDTASITFDITVEEDMVTSFGDKTVGAQTLIVGEAFTLTLPEVNVGDHPITYTLRPGIPPPLTLVGRTISGTPIAAFRTITQTWTATDEDDDTASLTFDFTVEADVSPNFTDISVADQSYRQGVEIADLTLPSANSGNAPLTYALTPALPAGLTLTDGVISGTPTGSLAETEFTWTVTDANDDEAELTFDITIAANLAPSFAGESVDDQSYIAGTAIAAFDFPAATSGDDPVVYSLSPALPSGMSRSGFRVSGTPSAAVAETEYTWTATDADDDTDSLTFSITVVADLQPNFTGLSVDDQSLVEDIAITAFTLPDAASGNAPLSYTLTPALPAGLSLTGRTVSGTPTAALAETEYTWEVTDAK